MYSSFDLVSTKIVKSQANNNRQQSVHMPYTFSVLFVNIGEENVGECLTICQFFPYQNFPIMVRNYYMHPCMQYENILD